MSSQMRLVFQVVQWVAPEELLVLEEGINGDKLEPCAH